MTKDKYPTESKRYRLYHNMLSADRVDKLSVKSAGVKLVGLIIIHDRHSLSSFHRQL